MRQAMANADVGDDVFSEDPTVAKLEKKVSQLLGKEKALFVTSGTMGNLLSIMAHCWGRGYDIIVGDKSHIIKYEQGGASCIAGVVIRTIHNAPDGTISLDELDLTINPGIDPHKTKTKMVCLENTHNMCGGVVLSPEYCWKVHKIMKSHGEDIALHLDGARLLNAAVSLSVDPKELTEPFDSVNLCLSKGLGAPVGSVICGSQQFIDRARRLRKMVGGGWRQAGVLASCGLVALDGFEQKLGADHENALLFASKIKSVPGIELDLSSVQTNMVYFTVKSDTITAQGLVDQLANRKLGDGSSVNVGVFAVGPSVIRAVFHHQVSSDQVLKAADKISHIMTV